MALSYFVTIFATYHFRAFFVHLVVRHKKVVCALVRTTFSERKREKKKEERGNEQMINNFKKEKEELRPM